MRAYDPVDRIETDSRSFTDILRGKERFKEMRLHRVRNTRTVVDNFNENEIKLPRSANHQLTLTAHGIDGVVDEVGPNLIQLAPTSKYARQSCVVFTLHFHAAFQPEFQHRQGTVDAPMNVDFLFGRLVHVGVFLDG